MVGDESAEAVRFAGVLLALESTLGGVNVISAAVACREVYGEPETMTEAQRRSVNRGVGPFGLHLEFSAFNRAETCHDGTRANVGKTTQSTQRPAGPSGPICSVTAEVVINGAPPIIRAGRVAIALAA